jgi:hypothetical protein
MTAWTGDVQGLKGANKYPKAEGRKFKEPLNIDLYDRYVPDSAQANGIIAHVYIPKSVTVAASDTLTLTVK